MVRKPGCDGCIILWRVAVPRWGHVDKLELKSYAIFNEETGEECDCMTDEDAVRIIFEVALEKLINDGWPIWPEEDVITYYYEPCWKSKMIWVWISDERPEAEAEIDVLLQEYAAQATIKMSVDEKEADQIQESGIKWVRLTVPCDDAEVCCRAEQYVEFDVNNETGDWFVEKITTTKTYPVTPKCDVTPDPVTGCHAFCEYLNFNETLKRSADYLPENDIRVFPNPANNFVKIYSGVKVADSFELLDLIGNRVFSSRLNENGEIQELDVTSLNPGVYTFVVSKDGIKIKTGKFTINR